MFHTAAPIEPSTVDADAPLDTHIAFNLGWDRAFHGLVCGTDDPQVVAGYNAAQAADRRRSRRPDSDRFVRKWLQLRLNAWTRGRVFDEAVTPDYLRSIDNTECPILGCKLTYSTRAPTDWSVDRIHNDGAYAVGNLVVMSTQANKAKGNLGLLDVLLRGEGDRVTDGLTSRQWLRMASLMESATALATPGWAEVLPFAMLPAPGVHLSLSQTLQWLLLLDVRAAKDVHVVRAIRKTCLEPADRAGFDGVMKRLRKRAGSQVVAEDVWVNLGLFEYYRRWFSALQPASCDRIQSVLGKRGPIQRTTFDLQAWCVDSRGYYEDPRAASEDQELELDDAAVEDLLAAAPAAVLASAQGPLEPHAQAA